MQLSRKLFFISFFAILFVGLVSASLVFAETQNSSLTVGVEIGNVGCNNNNIKESGEDCDGTDLNSNTCTTIAGGYSGGTLTCSASCTFVTSACTSPPGGCSGDCSRPNISDFVISNLTDSSVKISWTATDDEMITGVEFLYGDNYSSSAVVNGAVGAVSGSFEVNLVGLTAATLYNFKVNVGDIVGTSTKLGSFTSLAIDVDNPLIISHENLSVGTTAVTISFETNIPAYGQINYGITSGYGVIVSGVSQAITNHVIEVPDLLPNTTYHYRIVANDNNGHSTSTVDAVFTTLPDDVVPPNVTNFTLTASDNSFILNWTNPTVVDFIGIKLLRKDNSTVGSSGIDDGTVLINLGNVQTYTDSGRTTGVDYSYTIYTFDTSLNHSTGAFQFGNLSDVAVEEPACSDEIDNDGDELIDMSDPGCDEGPDDTSEANGTISGEMGLEMSDVHFYAGDGNILLTPFGNRVSGLLNSALTISVARENLLDPNPEIKFYFIDGGAEYPMVLEGDNFITKFSIPTVGVHNAEIFVNYGYGATNILSVEINSLAPGLVIGTDGAILDGANLTLYNLSGQIMAMSDYDQVNPIISEGDGSYAGWMVPSGQYKIVVTKDGYNDSVKNIFTVPLNAINTNITMVKKVLDVIDVIDPNAPLWINSINVAKNLTDKAVETGRLVAQTISNIVADPQVKTTAQVVAPTAVGAVAVGTVAMVSWIDLLALLRFLFLQPLLLLGRGKRKQWGMVYNSLSKMPIDLAIVRLFDATTNKLIRSRVTDEHGRYAFIMPPGKYRIEVAKINLVFPTALLAGVQHDGNRPDIYHGEIIEVTEKNALVTANIPLDPTGAAKTPKRILRERFWRKTQSVVSGLGLVFTLAALYISPVWYMWMLTILHCGLILLFRRLAKPRVAKGWGIVSDNTTNKPVGRTVARLFDTQFNRLVATEVTDKKGRYNFLAGDNKYYVTYEHENYKPTKTDILDLTGKVEDAIATDAKLKKKD